MTEIEKARSALHFLEAGCSREEWVRIGMAAKDAGLEFEDFHKWSKNGDNYLNEKNCLTAWKSFSTDGGVTAATLFKKALERGWRDPYKIHDDDKIKPSKKTHTLVNNSFALEVWERCIPALTSHEYILRKNGNIDGLRIYPESAPTLKIQEVNVAGYLAVPCWSNGVLQTIQFIPSNKGKKLNLTGAKFNNGYFVVGLITDCIYICEGLSAAWSVNKASGAAAIVCFGSGRMMTVTKTLHSQYPSVSLVIVPDRGKEEHASKIASEVVCAWVELPQDKPENYDAGDFAQDFGHEELHRLLSRVKAPEMPLNVVFADKLPDYFIPPDELVEGMLTCGDGSILYGDSNSGKTFFVIDFACAIARGVDWMGKKTEPGLVIYLAAESPASVRRRLQAYQKHHDVRVMNFAIVQSPIDLFDGETDTDAVIQVIHLLEKQYGQKARLIVGDTLARLSAGANENAGQDMGLVVRHFDRIRNECDTHFMLIHHSGKNVAAGARGWSGVRAAVDTEIEVTDSSIGRCAEITKQRDLSTKGDRIGFQLETVTLGLTKWKSPATSCVVVASDAPQKTACKRLSEVGGAIIEYLRGSKNAVKKRELVKHFDGRYSSSSVYRELKKLVKSAEVNDSFGYVKFLVQSGAN